MAPLSERMEVLDVSPDILKEIEELEDEAASAPRLRNGFRTALEKLAELKVIDPTPHAIHLYLSGQREL